MNENESTAVQATEKQQTPKEELLHNIAALVKVKSIMTLLITGVFVILAGTGALQPETVMTIVSTVVAFYFGTQTAKKQ